MDVEALVEPAVMYYGDSIIIQIKLITLFPKEKQVFVEDYMVDKSQVLNLFSKISKQIADEILIELSPEEERLFAKSRTIDREAYDAFLSSQQYWGDLRLESLNKAKEFLNSAIEKDPNWAPLYAGLAKVWAGLNQMGFVSPEIAIPESYKNLNKALELDPLNPNMKIWASVAFSAVGDFKSALELGEEVAAADPNYFMAYAVIENAAFYGRDYNKVMEATKHLLTREVDFKEVERIFGESGFVAANEEILRQLEVFAQNGYVAPVTMAQRYVMVDQADKAMDWIEKGFEVRDPNMPYIAVPGFLCEPLFDNPRFIEILQKMNLPLPNSEAISTH